MGRVELGTKEEVGRLTGRNAAGGCDREFIAHVRKEKDGNIIQTVSEHCKNTAAYCRDTAKVLGIGSLGYYAGILHDAGKLSDEFQEYIIRAEIDGKEVHRGSVNHTFAAVAYTLKKFHTGKVYEKLTAELAAWAMGSHHGIFDINDLNKKNGFSHRLDYAQENASYQLSMQRFFESCISEEELCSIFSEACREVEGFHGRIFSFCKESLSDTAQNRKVSYSFFLGMAARILLSALIDADRSDTCEFMNKEKSRRRAWDRGFWREQLNYLERWLGKFPCDTEIDKMRKDISDQASAFAANMPDGGIFRLNVPTGAGKTLTSYRAALSAAIKGKVSRIIYVLPLLSIIDQNAKVIKQYSYDAGFVTEHHSNVVKEKMTKGELDQYELVCENWDNAVIVTTLVQFLNTLFSGKTQAIRRMHALAGSVIIIDEVQTVPLKMLYMFHNALNFLAYFCGCKIILCSATQPCFEKTEYMLKYSENCDMVKPNRRIQQVFQRTKILDKTDIPMSIGQLCDFSMELMKSSENLLIICNTKNSAESLFKEIVMMSAGEYKVFCLTANMCMKHRQTILRMINYFLGRHVKMVCVATQLVEAGVDVSFETLIRVRAGLDNLAQAAGRCNRSFDYGHICNVYMVRLVDEKLSYLKDIQNAQNSTMDFLYQYHKKPEDFDNDMLGEKSVQAYYSLLFGSTDVRRNFSYPVKKPQQTNLLNLLTLNAGFSDSDREYFLRQAFKTAGGIFEVFDSESFDVIVPYNREARRLIADICSEKAKYDTAFLHSIVQRAKPYIVSLWKYQVDRLVQDGMLQSHDDSHIYLLRENCYNRMTGLEMVRNEIY